MNQSGGGIHKGGHDDFAGRINFPGEARAGQIFDTAGGADFFH